MRNMYVIPSQCYEESFFSLEQLPDTQEGEKLMKET